MSVTSSRPRAGLLTFPRYDIVNLPVEITSPEVDGEREVAIKLPTDHPYEYARRWDRTSLQDVQAIKANDTLRQLFFNGPTFDGDMTSKSERGEMVGLGLVTRYDGYQTLTGRGLELCMLLGLDREKEKRERDRWK